jgi:hypothetical protein
MAVATEKVNVSLFGEDRELEVFVTDHALRTIARVVVGRFPTGAKLHSSSLTLWKRDQGNGRLLGGGTAAVYNGAEYVADLTLYLHNRNTGRIVAWNDDRANSGWTPTYDELGRAELRAGTR